MTLDPDICYRAVASRDARFDGRFFTAVTTTGIYCRPVCPARTPQRRNVLFFACAAAAEEAGFRPCRRCRPETAPGSPAWLGAPVTVHRALRLIGEGALDGHDRGDDDGAGVEALAARLGVGGRHLRRLFAEHLGASPLAVAQTRRLHFARQLLDQTDLPIARIAFASGFGSLRRFNDAMLAAYGASPSALRARAEKTSSDPAQTGFLTLRLPYRAPLAWDALLEFLAPRAIAGVEGVNRVAGGRGTQDGVYRRAVRGGDAVGTIEIRRAPSANCLLMRVSVGLAPGIADLVSRARRLFDLDADPTAIDGHLAADPLLRARVRERSGLRVPGAWDRFELAVRAVLGQQVSVRAATTIAGRIARALGEALPRRPGAAPAAAEDGAELTSLFPTPSALARADLARLGLTRARAETVRRLAVAVRNGELDLDGAADPEELRGRMEALSGIGPWTSQYIALRALGDPDAFPAGDLGVRRALGLHGHPATPAAALARAEAWRPWRAYATLHLWLGEQGE